MTTATRRATAMRRAARMLAPLAAAGALAAVGATATPAGAQSFSTGPLEAKIAWPADGLPTEPVGFVAWLRANGASPTEGQAEVYREHLYAILSADARARFAATRATLPTRDSVLAALYDLADRMGLPGGALVSASLFPSPKPMAPFAMVDSVYGLTYGNGVFTLTTRDHGWRVRFPHYFMIGRLHRQRGGAGDVDIVSLSTLCAANAPEVGGASQATILLLGSARPEDAEFVGTWMARLGFPPTLEPTESPIPGVPAYYTRDATTKLRKNLVIVRLPRATLVAAYVGLDGTYEANRPHFIDVLKSLHVAAGR